MTKEIIVSANAAIKKLSNGEGEPWGFLVRDSNTLPGRPAIVVTGPLAASGFPVTVVVPTGFSHIQLLMTNGNPAGTLSPGVNFIAPASVGFDAAATRVEFWFRAVNSAGRSTAWRKRILREPIDVVTPPTERMTLSGDLSFSTNGQVGSGITVTATPLASRTPDQTKTVLRLYTAATGGTLNSTVDPAPSTVPNNDTLFGELVYMAHDNVFDEWVEKSAATRFDIQTVSIDTDPIVSADVTSTAVWKAGGLRQQAIHTFFVTGSPHGTLLQARIATGRYDTGWVDCVQTGVANQWAFGSFPMPSGQPGAGRNCFEFYDMEDRFKVKLRRRASTAVSWTAESPNLVFPWPTTGGAEEFNALPTTVAGIETAIAAGLLVSGPYVIGLSGNMDFNGASVSISRNDVIKPGEPLIIKSVNRNTPVVISGISDGNRVFDFRRIGNIVIDRIVLNNNRTMSVGYPAGGVPARDVPAGGFALFDGCQIVHVTDCTMRNCNVAITFRDCDNVALTFPEISGTGQDGIRFYRRGLNLLVEGEYQHSPNIYDALALSSYQPPWHPDDIQLSVESQSDWIRPAGSRLGGFHNFRRLRGRSYGVPRSGSRYTAGYYGITELLKDITDYESTDMATGGARHRSYNWLWEDMYVESSWNSGPIIQGIDGYTARRVVLRKQVSNGRVPQLNLQFWAKNIVIENSVATYAPPYPVPTSANNLAKNCMTDAEMRDEVTGAFTASATAWPTGWTGGATRFPTGPDAYR